jgi:hypothetical protein
LVIMLPKKCATDSDYQSKIIGSKSILTTFEASLFWGIWGSIEHWLKHKIKPPVQSLTNFSLSSIFFQCVLICLSEVDYLFAFQYRVLWCPIVNSRLKGVGINFEQTTFDFFCLGQTSKKGRKWGTKILVFMFWLLLFISFNLT